MNKFVDISRNLFKNDSWNGELSFWGVLACKLPSGGKCQPLKWCPPRFLCRGDNDHTIGSFELKVIITVLGSSSRNSLASNKGVHLNKIKFLSGSQKQQLVWVGNLLLPRPFCLTKPKRE